MTMQELFTIDGLKEVKLSGVNLIDGQEECEEIFLPPFKDEIDFIEKLQTHFVYQNIY